MSGERHATEYGVVSINRTTPGRLSIYISGEMRVTARAVTEDDVKEMALNLANIVSLDVWIVESTEKMYNGSYFVKVVTDASA